MSIDDEIIEIRYSRKLAALLMLANGFFAVASILFLNIDISAFWDFSYAAPFIYALSTDFSTGEFK